MIDERTRAALSRLTENERVCLTRRLQHQTAKEMAIDLGISPHAVEKRLKMARTKLGVSSSLEAARLLEANERYDRTGPQTSDLGGQDGERQDSGDPKPAWRRIVPYALTGVIAMSLAVVALFAVAPLNAPGGVAPFPAGDAVLKSEQAQPDYLVQLTLKQGDRLIGSLKQLVAAGRPARASGTDNGGRYDVTLSVLEREGSAYLVKMEFESSSADGHSVHATPAVLVRAGETTNLTVGPSEEPLSLAVVVTPTAGKVPKSDRSDPNPVIGSTIKTLKEYRAENGETGERPRMVKALPEVVRKFVNESFDIQDKNHSGYLERAEAPERYAQGTAVRKGPMPKPGERPPLPDDDEQVVIMNGPSAQAAYLATMDKDADGKVSRDEYMSENYPRFLSWGVPANWNGAPKIAAR